MKTIPCGLVSVSLGVAAQLLAPRAGAADLEVVATIKPIHSLAAAVMAGVAEPRLLIDGAGSPHTFALKPSDAKALNTADVVLRVSDGLEPFMIKVLKSLPKTVRVVTLAEVPDLTLHAMRTGGTFEEHAHEKGGSHTGHKHSPGKANHKPDDAHEEGQDGHIWLDPANAKLIAAHIADVLATEVPEHADRLKANAAELSARLDALSAELKQGLEPLAGRGYVVFHDAYQYLEQRYGLSPVGSVTIGPDMAPSAKRLTELRRKISGLKATCVFAEPQFEPKLVGAIVEGTSARKGTLDPLGAAVPAGPELYFTIMRSLVANLRACLDPA
jgi:zinc transport system substrate-binding protein